MRTIKSILEEVIFDSGDDYILKTDEEIINMICEFGNGMLEFHTLDINRIIVENQRMKDLLKITEI